MSGGGGSSSGAGIPVLKAMAQGAGAIGKPSTLRDLGLAVLKIISYMCLGVLIYTFKEINEREDPEPDDWDWNVIECFYFTMVTITTVGYGDMPLLSQEIRVVTAFFGIVGVVQIAGSLNVIAEWFVERARKRFMNKQRGLLKEAQRAGAMVREQAPAPAGAAVAAEGGQAGARSSNKGLKGDMMVEPVGKADSPPPSPPETEAERPSEGGFDGLDGLGDGAMPPSPPPSPGDDAVSSTSASKVSQVVPIGGSDGADGNAVTELIKNEHKRQASPDSAAGGAGMRPSQTLQPQSGCAACLAKNPRLKYMYDMFMAFLPCLIFIIFCFVLGLIENFYYDCYDKDIYPTHDDFLADSRCWTAIDSFYYSFITLATIGYGDVTPHSVWGKLIATILIPFAIVSLTNFMGKIHDIKMNKKMGFDKTLQQRLTELEEVIAADDNGVVTPEEYILFNLKQMGKIDDDTVNLLREQFMALDADGSGELDADDLVLLQKACEVMAAEAERVAAAALGQAGS